MFIFTYYLDIVLVTSVSGKRGVNCVIVVVIDNFVVIVL